MRDTFTLERVDKIREYSKVITNSQKIFPITYCNILFGYDYIGSGIKIKFVTEIQKGLVKCTESD